MIAYTKHPRIQAEILRPEISLLSVTLELRVTITCLPKYPNAIPKWLALYEDGTACLPFLFTSNLPAVISLFISYFFFFLQLIHVFLGHHLPALLFIIILINLFIVFTLRMITYSTTDLTYKVRQLHQYCCYLEGSSIIWSQHQINTSSKLCLLPWLHNYVQLYIIRP